MSFVVLGVAIVSGVSGTLLTRASRGFKRWGYGVGAVAAYAVATVLLAWLVQRLPVGVVYALWTGVAAVVLLGVDRFVFKVPMDRVQLAGMAVTLVGVVLLSSAVA